MDTGLIGFMTFIGSLICAVILPGGASTVSAFIQALSLKPALAQPGKAIADCATAIEPNDVERVLTDINADYGRPR